MMGVIDCCDRSIIGWRISKSTKASVAVAALEDAIIRRNPAPGLRLRSDNGLIFASEKFAETAHSVGMKQEYITPYSPGQKWTDRALVQDPEGRVLVASSFQRFKRSTHQD